MKRDTRYWADRESWSRCYILWSRPRVAVYAIFACIFLTCTSCATSAVSDEFQDRFGIITSEGVVLSIAQGSAKGFTNLALTRLIRAGVAKAYAIQCNMSSDLTAARQQMVWHVINDGRKPTAMISVRVIVSDKIVRSAYKNMLAPDSISNAMFMRDVLDLVRRVLPPAGVPVASSQSGCP